jgi:hypothetical protein
MFALRKITEKGHGVEINLDLGDSYTLIRKDCNPQDFAHTAKVGGFDPENDGIYAFVSGMGAKIFPLYANQYNYIVTGNGATYANVSLR